MYKLPDLHLFLRAADAGNLSTAARQLEITPAAASAAIKRLEQALEARLFERSTRSLRLTPEGGVFREYCERALGVLADGESQVRTGRRALAGTIHLAAPSDLARTVLTPWLDEFLALYPQTRLVLHVSDTLHDLLRDTVDLALRYGELHDARLVARRLYHGRRVVCAAPAYVQRHGEPRTPQDLTRHNCLTFFAGGRQYTTWTFYEGKKPVTVKVSGDRCADDSSLARQWAIEGAGVVYKSGLDVAEDIRLHRLQPLLPDYQGDTGALNAVYLGARYLPLRVRTLLDFLVAKFETVA